MTLARLATQELWRECAHKNSVPLVLVLPSARSVLSGSPHLPLSSDGFHLPEIAVAIERTARSAGLDGAVVQTAFDIDVHEELEGDVADGLHTANLVIVGGGDVNIIAALVTDLCEGQRPQGSGYIGPSEAPSAEIRGADGELSVASTRYPNAGVLFVFDSPWAPPGERRIAILASGFFAMGTIGAARLLLHYATGEIDSTNPSDPNAPMRVVNAIPRTYEHTKLRDTSIFDPNMDLRNVEKYRFLE